MSIRPVLCVVLLLIAAAPAFAQDRTVDVTGFGAWFHAAGDEAENADLDLESDFGLGIGLNFFLSNRVSLELTASIFEPEGAIQLPESSARTSSPNAVTQRFGTVKMLPLTASLQYHFKPEERFDYYIGAGAAYLLFDRFEQADDIDFEEIDFGDDAGFMLQGGFSWRLKGAFAITGDVKYVPFEDSVNVSGATPLDIDLNPVILSAGGSYHF